MRATMRNLSGFSLVILLACTGCDSSTTPGDGSVTTCTEDQDCPTGEYCRDGVCTDVDQTCADGGTCPDGMVCIDGICVADGDGGIDGDGGDGGDGDAGPAPDIEVIEPGLSEGVYQLNFGNVLVGLAVTRQVTLRNVGDEELRIMQLNFEMGTDVEDFSIDPDTLDALPVVLQPEEDMVFDVIYSASDGRTDHGVLDVVSNDPDEALVQIHLLSEFKGEARVEVSPQALPFGDVPVGSVSQPLTFTIANQGTGNAVLTIDDVRPEIVGNPNFGVSVLDSDGAAVELPGLLNNGDFYDVEVVFQPQSRGQLGDNIAVLSNDAINPALMVAVTGRGVVGAVQVDPSPIALGRVRVGEHAEQVVTITNAGGANLSLTGIELVEPGPDWSLSSADVDLPALPDNPLPLAPEEAISLLLAFDPAAVGEQQTLLWIDNTTEDGPIEVPVSAEGFIPAAVETEPSPPELNFGDVQLDVSAGMAERVTMSVLIRNVGGEPLAISSIQRGEGSLDFTFDPESIAPIEVGLEVPLNVHFEPSSYGVQSGTILVDTSDPDIAHDGIVGRFRIMMQANGIDPNVFVFPANHDFGNVYVGRLVSQTITVQNAGIGPLVVDSIALSAGSSNAYTLSGLPGLPTTLNPMGNLTLEAGYLPASLGDDLGAILIGSSDIGNPEVQVDLYGLGSECEPNTIDCNGDPQDGCETPCVPSGAERCNYIDDDCDCDTDEDFDLDSDVEHCGGCNNACEFPNAQPTCNNGSCELLNCLTGWRDCNGQEGDGCEIHSDSDEENCGDCGNQCQFDHAQAQCLGGICVMGACGDGYADCNGSDADGCEIDTDSDPANCNGCGNVCYYDNAVPRCLGGTCDLEACLPGFANCNGSDGDGCEIDLQTDPDNCGWCGHVCPDAGGTPVCVGGNCGVSDCASGWADCDGDGIDCETDIANDPNNCGGCGNVCDLDHATADCVAQACVVDTCETDWGDCDGQNPNGCETDLTSTSAHCGFCGRECQFDHGSAACQDSDCVLTGCDDLYYDIDGNPDTGCECQGDTVVDLCIDGEIEDHGVLSDGEVLTLTNNLVPDDLDTNRDQDWYTFRALDNQTEDLDNRSDDYHLKIEFDQGGGNPNNQFAFDVYRSTNTGHGCADKGSPVCAADIEYDYATMPFANKACVPTTTGTAGERLCHDGSSKYWIRVFRVGALVDCSDYIINITFTQ